MPFVICSMTQQRDEISVEGSVDGIDWLAYEFSHKPGAISRAPTVIAPLHPRLDWQMWFAALNSYEQNVRFFVALYNWRV